MKTNVSDVNSFGQTLAPNANKLHALMKNVVVHTVNQALKSLLDTIKMDKKLVNEIKEDAGYCIRTETMLNERRPIDYFMSIPDSTSFKSIGQQIVIKPFNI